MATKTFKDILTKISYVFKSDIYIINNEIILGGVNSEDKNIGTMMCVLTDEAKEIYNKEFDNILHNDFFKIKDVKAAKKNLKDEIELSILPTTKEGLVEKMNQINSNINEVSNWDTLNLSEDDLNNFFNKGLSIELFTNRTDIPNVTISKMLFPMLSEKNFSNFTYSASYTEELAKFISKFETEFFVLYNTLYFLDI